MVNSHPFFKEFGENWRKWFGRMPTRALIVEGDAVEAIRQKLTVIRVRGPENDKLSSLVQ